jgi:hypothetical protein
MGSLLPVGLVMWNGEGCPLIALRGCPGRKTGNDRGKLERETRPGLTSQYGILTLTLNIVQWYMLSLESGTRRR